MSTIVVGDAPGGLSAALFLAKEAPPVTVLGQDKRNALTPFLHNYLGIEEIHGSDLQAIGRRQVEHFAERSAASGSMPLRTPIRTSRRGYGAAVSADDHDRSAQPRAHAEPRTGRDRTGGYPSTGCEAQLDPSALRRRLKGPEWSQAITAGDALRRCSTSCPERPAKTSTDWDSPPKEE